MSYAYEDPKKRDRKKMPMAVAIMGGIAGFIVAWIWFGENPGIFSSALAGFAGAGVAAGIYRIIGMVARMRK